MKKQKSIAFAMALVLMAGGVILLNHFRSHRELGLPGVKTASIAGSANLKVLLPEQVLDYNSEEVEIPAIVTNTLPKDTSFGQRIYKAGDRFETQVNVVLMGTDRTSLHKPQFCLEGQGWTIDQGASTSTTVAMKRPVAYNLPVVKLIASKEGLIDGQRVVARGIYVYWYVADGTISASTSGFERMWRMTWTLLRTGVLQRWAYISYFATCPPGREDATFNRIKELIAASVPEFQLTPAPHEAAVAAAARQ
jgi:Protein of unknown function (DUF3485)